MNRYHWVITKDHIEKGKNSNAGTIGPRTATLDSESIVKAGAFFKIYDCDDILYYEGYITGDYDGFEPLDDFGTPNAGATDIHYRNQETGIMECL